MSLDARARIIITAVAREAVNEMQRAGKEMQKLDKQAADAAKRQQMLTTTARRSGMALLGMATAGGVLIASSTRLAARVETLGVVTRRLGENVGVSRDEMDDLEKSVKAQGITLQSTRASIARMIQAEIDLAHATDLARLAQDAAVISNQDSSATFVQLINTISAGNVRMARTLGLQVSFEQAYSRTAEALGKNINELTQQEKVQARVNEIMRAGVNISGAYEEAMGTAGKQVLSLNRHIEESRRIIGEVFLPQFSSAVEKVTELLESFEDAPESIQKGNIAILATSTAIAGVSGAALILVSMVPNIVAGLTAIGIAGATVAGPLVAAAAALGFIIVAANKAAAENKVLAGSVGQLRRRYELGIITQKEFQKQLVEVTDGTTFYNQALLQFENRASSAATMNDTFGDTIERLALDKFPVLNLSIEDVIENTGLMAEKAAIVANRFEDDVTPAVDATAEAMREMGDKTKKALDTIDRGLGDVIENMIKDIDFLEAGGLEIMATWQGIQSAMAQGVPVGQLVGPMQELQNTILATKVAAGLLTAKEAQQQAKEWGFAFDPAAATVAQIAADIARISGDHTARIRIETENVVVTRGGGSRGSCFVAGTMVTMSDGAEKPIEKIRPGDRVRSFNEKLEFYEGIVTWIKPESRSIVNTIKFLGGVEIQVSDWHPIYTPAGWTRSKNIEPAMEVYSDNGRIEIVASTRRGDDLVNVYNFMVGDGDGDTYIANGILVHNAVAKQHGGSFSGVALVGDPGPNAELVIGQGTVIPAAQTKALIESGAVPIKKFQGGGSFSFDSDTLFQISQAARPKKPASANIQNANLVSKIKAVNAGSAESVEQVAASAASQEVAKAIEQTVTPALSSFAAALPKSDEIGLAVGRQLQLSQAEVIRSNQELIALVEITNELLVLQGTSDDQAQAMASAVSQVAG